MGTDRRLRRSNRPTRAPLFLLPALLCAGLWLTVTPGVSQAQVPALGPPVSQCNDMANVGATTTTCEVTITNNITYNADGTSTTASVIVTTVNGVTTSTTSTSPITEISQCNRSGRDGAATVTCTSTITNNITGAPASAVALSTIDQCNPLLGAPTETCTATPAGPNATGGHQAIGQCNQSGATGTVTCTATTGAATDSSPAAAIDQCNESGTTGASTLTCTATLSNTFTCAGTTTTLAHGACFSATATTLGATTPTTGATSPTTVGSVPTTSVPGGSGGTTTPTSRPAPGGGSSEGGTSEGGTSEGGAGEGEAGEGEASAGTTETTVDSSSRTSRLGEAVGFTATVQGSGPTPTGSVTFFDGSTELGTVPLIAGRAILWTSDLTVGEHDITARFDGAGGTTSTSPVTRQTVIDEPAGSSVTRGPIQTTLAQTGSTQVAKLALGLLLVVGGFAIESALSTRARAGRAAPAPDTY